ncbi:hypothetical protein CEY11_21345 [Candidimonas nitroreducens]|uniref:DNA-binding protein n=1 Tax=Candidimonas nitroreducens TaxID=683354 RepID=A0A225M1R5_9BURK|nr:hypothetical protein CEY11_21345 [Candidimonas nitroreducens]
MDSESPARGRYYTTTDIAVWLGKHPVTIRSWRVRNAKAGFLKYGPPYEYRDGKVVYPVQAFRDWCAGHEVIDGVVHMALPLSAVDELQRYADEVSRGRNAQ